MKYVVGIALGTMLAFGALAYAQDASETSASPAQQQEPAKMGAPVRRSEMPAKKAVHAKHMTNTVRGTVASVDSVNNKVVILEKNGAEKTISVTPEQLNSVKQGEPVKVTLKEGSPDAASRISVVNSKIKAKESTK